MQMGVDGSGHLYITNQSTTWTSSGIIAPSTWYYVEFKVKFTSSTASGDVEGRVDGASFVTVPASVNTGTVPDLVGLGSFSGFINDFTMYFDDFVLQTGSTTYFGDVIVEARKPNADGTYTELTAPPIVTIA
jgi:hypothetical protein